VTSTRIPMQWHKKGKVSYSEINMPVPERGKRKFTTVRGHAPKHQGRFRTDSETAGLAAFSLGSASLPINDVRGVAEGLVQFNCLFDEAPHHGSFDFLILPQLDCGHLVLPSRL
jgi:hypothetical protein